MRKITAVLGAVLLTFFMANSAMAQILNSKSYFLIDTNLATAGLQDQQPIDNIGPSSFVGCELWSQAIESATGFIVHFEWTAANAVFTKSISGANVVTVQNNINGATITPAAGTNQLGANAATSGEINDAAAGIYEISIATADGSTVTSASGLIYEGVWKTTASFTTATPLTVLANVSVIDANGVTRFLGTRYLYINQKVEVKTSSWGDVKKQFKDF